MKSLIATVPFLSGLAVALAFFINWTSAYERGSAGFALQKRFVNSTELDACKSISSAMTTQGSKVVYALDLSYLGLVKHFMTSSTQLPACVAVPASPADLSAAIKVIGSKRIRFAVEAAGHASNQGFSSTPGVHINLKNFQQVNLSGDKSYVDVGPGNVWDNVYSGLEGAGVAVVGGRVSGVGVGGFITGGGGYSWKTNQYGLTGDTLISADIVLPDGTLTTASASQNADLFWAIRAAETGLASSTTSVSRRSPRVRSTAVCASTLPTNWMSSSMRPSSSPRRARIPRPKSCPPSTFCLDSRARSISRSTMAQLRLQVHSMPSAPPTFVLSSTIGRRARCSTSSRAHLLMSRAVSVALSTPSRWRSTASLCWT